MADEEGKVSFQVLNVGPSTIKLYKGMKIATFVPIYNVLQVMEVGPSEDQHVNTDIDRSLTKREQEKLLNLLQEYCQLFQVAGENPGRTTVARHHIHTDGPPIKQPLRMLPEPLKQVVSDEVSTMLDQGVIRRSCSPWSSPAILVKKKDNSWRFCLDYRKLNAITKKDSSTFDEHLERLRKVFDHLATAGLKLKTMKCHFAKREVCYLGHIVSANGIRPDPAKITAVKDYPVPRNLKELKQFLGLTNYYRRFVKGYSKIAEPLHKLTRKSAHGFHWNSECDTAFQKLKDHLCAPPILVYPNFKCPFFLYTDASATAVLSQEQDGVENVVAYWSRQLAKAERNYSTIECEALAAVAAIKILPISLWVPL